MWSQKMSRTKTSHSQAFPVPIYFMLIQENKRRVINLQHLLPKVHNLQSFLNFFCIPESSIPTF